MVKKRVEKIDLGHQSKWRREEHKKEVRRLRKLGYKNVK